MSEWECPICGYEMVALDGSALAPHVRRNMEEHEDADE